MDAILEAAAYVLAERGYAKATTNRIAARAGVNIASLYQYFPSKEALLAALLRRHAVAMRSGALARLEKAPARSRKALVRVLVEHLVEEHRRAPALHRVFAEESARLSLGPIRTEVDERLARERDRRLRAMGEEDLPTWIATTAAHAVVHAAVSERPDALENGALRDELVAMVDAYLGRRRRPARR